MSRKLRWLPPRHLCQSRYCCLLEGGQNPALHRRCPSQANRIQSAAARRVQGREIQAPMQSFVQCESCVSSKKAIVSMSLRDAGDVPNARAREKARASWRSWRRSPVDEHGLGSAARRNRDTIVRFWGETRTGVGSRSAENPRRGAGIQSVRWRGPSAAPLRSKYP